MRTATDKENSLQQQKRYEILDGLPAYGPMYIPVSENEEEHYSEGFVVRFFKSDGTEWVANFKPGWTDCCLVVDYPHSNRMVVIAYGQGYIMNPEQQKPIDTFGVNIKYAVVTKDNTIVTTDDIYVAIIDDNGVNWQSKRISIDGIKDLMLHENTVTGLACNPMGNSDEWIPFAIDLETKEITGGSW